ncbi:MAG: hypothetical protein U0599_04075 [Vicinamibacteria bacterium]
MTKDRLDLLREADAIFVEEIKAGLYKLWQSFAVLLPVGRSRSWAATAPTGTSRCGQWSPRPAAGLTADWVRLPYDLLARASSRIVNEVRGINRVVYDVSSKPPSTIEWE